MDALIIAAGFGSRLADISPSKPLTPIAGVPLIELGVRQAQAAGARRIVVVTGHEAARLEAFLRDLAQRVSIKIVTERCADWSLPNGYSVMAGAARISGNYLLMMADHIFAGAILRQLACQGSTTSGVTLAVDRRIDNAAIDPDDVTWVKTQGGDRIVAIGKHLTDYDAADCGAFLATPELAEAIAQAIAAGKAGSLSDGMQRLADRGRAATMDIGSDENDAWWLDVDDARAHARAELEAPRHLPQFYAAIMDRSA